MEIKKNLEVSSGDFWYDLTSGGYIKPEEICENKEDAYKVNEAIKVIVDFQKSCEKEIEGFIM